MSSAKPSFRERMRYSVDNFLARGSGALFLALLVTFFVSFAIIIGIRVILNLIDPDTANGLTRQIWFIFLQITDPGNMAQDTDTPTLFKVGAVVAGFSGVVIFSALIAFLTTALDQAIANLKKGHSRVLETGHTLILGWGPRVIEILRELVEANESEKDPVVVVLSEEEKEEMDEYLRAHFTDRRNTRLVTRSGSTASLADLKRVSADTAKSAIVLASCSGAISEAEMAASDAKVIKTVLALDTLTKHMDEFTIVAEIFHARNRQVVRDITPQHAVVIDAEEILAKIMVQTSRTSGLSVVYAELLSFEGCEMYFSGGDWDGLSFGQIQFHFPDGVPIGVRRSSGALVVRPAPDTPMSSSDEVLIVANDDSTIDFRPQPVYVPKDLELPRLQIKRQKERMAILGWSSKARIVAAEYADYVLPGSTVDVVIKSPPASTQEEIEALRSDLASVTVNLLERDPLDSESLASLHPFSYNNIVILPQNPEAELNAERIDAETIVVLLHLRRLAADFRAQGLSLHTKIITEVLDSSNQDLVNQAGVNDFLISNRMVSMILAQLSEQPGMQLVYDDLFEEAGSEIYVKPAALYFREFPVTCHFGDLMKLTQQRDGEVCIGYKLSQLENDGEQNYGVSLIPPKDSQVTLSRNDAIVVVAEDDR